jgi:hypothetical protein
MMTMISKHFFSSILLALAASGCGTSSGTLGAASGGRDCVGQWTMDVEESAKIPGSAMQQGMQRLTSRDDWNRKVEEGQSRLVVEFFEDGRFKFGDETKKGPEGTWRFVSTGDYYELEVPSQKERMKFSFRNDRLYDLNTSNPNAIVLRRFPVTSGTTTR